MAGGDRRGGLLDDLHPECAADLDAWVYWVRRYGDGLGHGSTSIAWRMMEAKRTGIFARGTSVEPQMPAHVAAIDAAIAKLDRHERKALRTYYLWYAPVADKARRCHCSVPTFYARLKRARRCVGDFWLSTKNAA
jgi:hypothetical protein